MAALPRLASNRHVRFTPKSRHLQCTGPCLLWAIRYLGFAPPAPTNVRYASNSDQILRGSEMTRWANRRHQRLSDAVSMGELHQSLLRANRRLSIDSFGAHKDRWRDRDAKRFGGLHIDDKVEASGSLKR